MVDPNVSSDTVSVAADKAALTATDYKVLFGVLPSPNGTAFIRTLSFSGSGFSECVYVVECLLVDQHFVYFRTSMLSLGLHSLVNS